MITYQSIPSYWASSQALAHFGLEMIFNSINKPLKGPYFDCWYFLCLASKRTPIDISEPVVWHVYWSAVFRCNSCHFNISRWRRHINNALKELKDCIRGLLHLGPNVITFRTVITFRPSTSFTKSLLNKFIHFAYDFCIINSIHFRRVSME